jgi:hypothetical protein
MRQAYQMGKMRFQVDELWADQRQSRADRQELWKLWLQTGKTEAAVKNIVTPNPGHLTDKGKGIFGDAFKKDLTDFYCSVGKNLNELDLFKEIQSRFGDRLNKEVCLPNGLLDRACIVAAMAVAMEHAA